jgi:deoxyribonuclease-4
MGGKLEELHCLRELAARECSLAIGYCLDTCHLLAAGFNIAEERGLAETVTHVNKVLGLDHVHLIHANDSKQPLGSHLDRHANIGEGHIGEAGFRRILQHARLRKKPFVLETPVDEEGDDRRNVDALKRLAARRPLTE